MTFTYLQLVKNAEIILYLQCQTTHLWCGWENVWNWNAVMRFWILHQYAHSPETHSNISYLVLMVPIKGKISLCFDYSKFITGVHPFFNCNMHLLHQVLIVIAACLLGQQTESQQRQKDGPGVSSTLSTPSYFWVQCLKSITHETILCSVHPMWRASQA